MKTFSLLSRFVGGRAVTALSLTLLVGVVVGCGGGGSSNPSPTPTPGVTPTPTVTPTPGPTPTPSPNASPVAVVFADAVDIPRGQSVKLSWNSRDGSEVASSNFDAATLFGEKFVTPLETTTYTFSVRNAGGQTGSGSVEVRVATVGISVTPSPATVDVSSSLTFTAAVTGAVDTGVNWSVEQVGGGTINAAGVYSAPATAGVYRVRATSNADTSKIAVVEVRVRAASGTVSVN